MGDGVDICKYSAQHMVVKCVVVDAIEERTNKILELGNTNIKPKFDTSNLNINELPGGSLVPN